MRQDAAQEQAAEQGPGEMVTVPRTVFDRMTELERQLSEAQAELEAREAKLKKRRAGNAERVSRWKKNHPDAARRQAQKDMQALRARRKAEGS